MILLAAKSIVSTDFFTVACPRIHANGHELDTYSFKFAKTEVEGESKLDNSSQIC
jgi:hypothetical protein